MLDTAYAATQFLLVSDKVVAERRHTAKEVSLLQLGSYLSPRRLLVTNRAKEPPERDLEMQVDNSEVHVRIIKV